MLVLVVSLLVCYLPFSTDAVDNDDVEYFNYRQYIENVTVDGTNDIVTVSVPMDMVTGNIAAGDWTTLATWQGSIFSGYQTTGEGYYHAMVYPFGEDYLSLSNIPDDADYRLTFYVTGFTNPDKDTVQYIRLFERYIAGDTIYRPMRYLDYGTPTGDSYLLSVEDSFSSGYDGFSPEFDVYFYSSGATTLSVELISFELVLTISSYYRALDEMGYTEQIDELRKELESQGKQLEDILDQQQQTNDKLDALPGQIGDEMQGVIDNEKDEANSEGNKFVDQILGALPDPSTDVLAALKSLTDATAYTGTDAVLPIPAIVLPGIDGLFPETEIWGGTDFDLGEFISLLPPTLLTLVQSLFTIAIVLYCVYELKGIISYCLTLKESKGG